MIVNGLRRRVCCEKRELARRLSVILSAGLNRKPHRQRERAARFGRPGPAPQAASAWHFGLSKLKVVRQREIVANLSLAHMTFARRWPPPLHYSLGRNGGPFPGCSGRMGRPASAGAPAKLMRPS
jgi:hypothetical protein